MSINKLSEAYIQHKVVVWFNLEFPQYRGLFFHIPNERQINLISQGLVAGIPDMFLSVPAQGYHGLYIEFKKPGGRLSDKQKKLHPRLEAQGYYVTVMDDIDKCKAVILDYLHDLLY